MPRSAKAQSSKAKASPAKVKSLDRLNIFIAVFGLVAVVVGLLSQIWIIAIIAALSAVVTFTIVAIIEKSIGWPAWRVIIALVVASYLIFVQYAPPKVESFQVDMSSFLDWPAAHGITLSYYPITDDPETGRDYNGDQISPYSDQPVYDINVRCWAPGHLFGKSNVNVDWVSVKDGPYDGLWIPFAAVNTDSPGLARNLPNCNSWWLKLWPF